ncbi:hypothetical protein J4221_01800 [Candidatus Pacearchaeota archaeon]|nr:hypothetical protein [Candidatus Pacearchaeota archaeon]
MLNNKRGILFVLSFFLILFSPLLIANHNQVTYEYLIGNQFLEEFGPVVSMAKNGDTIELEGGGMFTLNPRTINGSGTVIHRDAEGNIIGTGKWKAIKLISFKKYGKGTPQGLPENFEGGRALIKVIIDPDDIGESFEGTLVVTCIIGDKIPKRAEEGIRLAVREVPINFNEEISGATLFIRKD